MQPIVQGALIAALSMGLAACATQAGSSAEIGRVSLYDDIAISSAASATAVRTSSGDVVGLEVYDTPGAAVRAGDMAAFVALVQQARLGDNEPGDFGAVVVAMDRAAAGDTVAARAALQTVTGEPAVEATVAFTDAWLSALDGDEGGAIDRLRDIGDAMPGLTGDLALAAMLEAFERHDEALAVYESLTPTRIEAPDHLFDPRGILFAHAQMVVSRRTLLLRRLGRIDEAKAVYAKLAAAEPEEATRYNDAIASLTDEDEFEDEFLTPRTAFARAFSDLSLSLYQRRIILAAMVGARLNGFDENRSAMDQLALMLDPDNESMRETVINGLYDEALYEGAAHVAVSAPDPTPRLQLSAASAYLMTGDEARARGALDNAVSIGDDDDRLETLTGSLRLYTLLGEEARAIELAGEARASAENSSEKAVTHALTASSLQHFGRNSEAVSHARMARDLDDTHDRRMALADVLGAAGEIDEALKLIRTERLGRPNDPYMLNTLGYFLITRTDRLEEGFRVLARAYALADRDPYIADSFGWARLKLGDIEGARRLIEQARAELDPKTHWEIEDHLGDIHWYQGDEDEARAAWERALTEYPPEDKRALIADKLANGLTEPAPEARPLPDVSLDAGAVDQQDI